MPSDRDLHCLLTGTSIQNTVNMITFSRKPLKFGNGLIEMIGLIDTYKTFKLCRFVFFQIVGIRDWHYFVFCITKTEDWCGYCHAGLHFGIVFAIPPYVRTATILKTPYEDILYYAECRQIPFSYGNVTRMFCFQGFR